MTRTCISIGAGILYWGMIGCAHKPSVSRDVKHDQSAPVSAIMVKAPSSFKLQEHGKTKRTSSDIKDHVIQTAHPKQAAKDINFFGMGYGYIGPQGAWSTVGLAFPDSNLAIGPNHIVQTVNLFFAVWSKSGTPLLGWKYSSTIFSGFSGACGGTIGTEPTVHYDRAANRWVFSFYAKDSTSGAWYSCAAVSTSGDPTGSYYRYQFSASGLPDYPKMGVWSDAYYWTADVVPANSGLMVATACGYERTAMLTGASARQICFTVPSGGGVHLLPAELDGASNPPTGASAYLMGLDPTLSSTVNLWKFHTDWNTPSNSTFTEVPITVAGFNVFTCADAGGVPQPNSTTLDVMTDRLIYRVAYRNFGDHESLVAVHNVCGAGPNVGERWYEFHNPGGVPVVYQQSTYAPADGLDRWLGSIAQNKNGDLALGFSEANISTPPRIRYAGRLATDPLGQLTVGEGSVVDGLQFPSGGLIRWGEYSWMGVDPSDDCTFFYTNQYYLPGYSTSTSWSTRIGSFQLSTCQSPVLVLTISPTSVTLSAGQTQQFIANQAVTWQLSGKGSLSSTGLYQAPMRVHDHPSATITAINSAGSTVSANIYLQ